MKTWPAFAVFLALPLLALPLLGHAETYTLEYTNQNKWVGDAGRPSQSALLSAAKKGKTVEFEVALPKQDRALAIKRLEVLQDILTRSLNKGILLIENAEKSAPENTLQITYPKP